MALGTTRIVLGQTQHAHEKEAIDFAIGVLPNVDPYHVWGLFELPGDGGRLYECDLLVLAHSGLYLIEIKSRPGVYTGDHLDWEVEVPGRERPVLMDNPYRLTNYKAKVLSSLLRRKLHRVPWVQPLVFLSAPDLSVKLDPDCNTGVVIRKTLARALTHHEFPGSKPEAVRYPVNTPMMRDVVQAIREIGIKPSRGALLVGSYELTELLDDGDNYQEWAARHASAASVLGRARVYLEPKQADVEQRRSLRRAAEREVVLLQDVREHRSILHFRHYEPEGPLGPTVLYDPFEGGEPLDSALRRRPELSLDARLEIVREVGSALQHCHNRGVVHGNLHPQAVLVRFNDSGSPDVRLFKFQLGRREASSGTQHRSVLQVNASKLYQAPELFEDPAATSPVTDVFSLGALAYFLLTGTEPAPTWMDLLVLLREHQALNPLRVSNDIPAPIAQLVEEATQHSAALRSDNAGAWIELLLEAATAPDAPAIDEVSPFEAKARDTLGAGRFEVQGVLGRGATSHVLKVTDERHGGRAFALKVSLEERHDERLRAEAEALGKLNDRRIVRLEEELSIAGRTALRLSIAGSRTLQAQLAAEGPVSLDFACRYGEDLLDSLAHLEETSVPHRDIKPANLGIGASNGRRSNHLVLFDFSLVGVPPEEIGVGTAVYRDPFLVERQRWDAAGDRWSAAVTLHEMLTGERPHFSGPALDPTSALVLAPERFEVGREELVEFFTRALARDADDRFGSAEAMKRAWSVCFAERRVRAGSPAPTRPTSATPAGRGGAAATPGVTREVLVDATIDGELAAANDLDAQGLPAGASVSGDPESSERVRGTPAIDYAAIAPEQPIAQLPLSARARNGLERAGMVHARDLLSLPDNHVSAVRGVGRSVAQEILGFREKWRVARAVAEVTAAPFLDAYAGPNLDVSRCDGISDAVARVLGDGALKTLAQVAAAPAPRVEALCFAAGATPQTLRDVLAREAERAAEAKLPTSLESWIALLFDGRSKARGYVRELYGLDGPGAGRLDVTGAELAKVHAINPVNIYVAVAKQRATWTKLEALPQLLDRCAALLEPSAGLLPLREAAQQLLAVLPHAAATPDELRVAQAAALWRVLAEATAESATLEPRILLERIDRSDQGSLWVARDAARLDEVRRLGKSADALAARDVLASPAEAQRVLLQELDPGSDLGQLPSERLVSLAASASRSAAASAHLEIYPQGMATERALRHSAAILTGPLTQQDVERRVWGRYPQAAPLPDAARWPALLAQVGFSWDGQHFQPKSAGTGSTHGTATRFTPHREPPSEIELAARDFHALVQSAIEQGDVRLFAVPSRHARQATQKLAREFARFRLETVSLDHVLFEEMQSIARRKSIKLEALYRADAEGAHGNHWHNLRRVAQEAASQLAARWLPGLRTVGAAPCLFVQLGLVARYGLTPLLETLTHADTAAAVLFLIAGDSTTGFAVNHTLTVPGVLPSHCTRLSSAWLHADPDATRERTPLQRAGGA